MNVPDSEPGSDPSVRAVAALDDELRRRMYAFIRGSATPVTREQVGAAVGISRKLAAFHLDKLVEVGLLRAEDAPMGGIARVGRRPKVYQPTDLDVRVAIPARQHDELAEILIDAVLTQAAGEHAWHTTLRVAHQRGHDLGTATLERTRPGRLGADRALALADTALRQWGFEPTRPAPSRIRLRNCPFHPLTAKSPELVCGINHAFLSGFLAGLHASGVEAVLDPAAGECCVELCAPSVT
nr:helix-turn-helix domain-containing protein [Pseudonocardia acaciae]